MLTTITTEYLDFDVRFSRTPAGYRTHAEGAGGEASASFSLPFTDDELQAFIRAVDGMSAAVGGGLIPEPVKPTTVFGESLYRALLNGPVRDLYIRTSHSAELQKKGLRLKLRLTDTPELASIPWEFMYDSTDFVGLSTDTSIVRYLDLPNAPRPMRLALPLRILVTISDPTDLPPLDVDGEREKIETALSGLTQQGLVEITFTEDASLNTLNRALSQARSAGRPFHVWHYIGHGQYKAGASTLAFEGRGRQASAVGGFQLGTLFNGAPELRLAMLNACEGARTGESDPFAGVSAALVERGIPAVIGMQFEIGDIASITLSEEFYRSIASGLPVDAALTEARRAVFFAPNWVEWATPVLFMRVRDGKLFDMQQIPKKRVEVDDRPPSSHGEVSFARRSFGDWFKDAIRSVDEVIERGRSQLGEQMAKVEDIDWGEFGSSQEMIKASAALPAADDLPLPEPETSQQVMGEEVDGILFRPLPHLPGAADSGMMKEPWRIILELYNGDDPPPMLGIDLYGEIVLGRGSGSGSPPTLGLQDYGARERGVSRRHLMLKPTAEGVVVIDQNSTNKTLVNGELIEPGAEVRVRHNDTIRIGRLAIGLFVVRSPND